MKTPVGAYTFTSHKTIEELAEIAGKRSAAGEDMRQIIQDIVDGYNLGWQSANHVIISQAVHNNLPVKFIAILIDPKGEEWFDAYGPMTTDRSKATRFITKEVAHSAAQNRFGRSGIAFWNSEREAEQKALKDFQGWTSRVEPENQAPRISEPSAISA